MHWMFSLEPSVSFSPFLPTVSSLCDYLILFGLLRILSPPSPPALAMPMLPSPLVKDNGAKLLVPRSKIYTLHLLTNVDVVILGTDLRCYALKV